MRTRGHGAAPPQHFADHCPVALPSFGFRLSALGKLLMHDRIDDPVRRVGRTRPRSSRYPAERVELLEDRLGFAPCQVAHASVATLDVAVGDALELVGQDVAGNRGQPVMVVRKPQGSGIEGQRVRQQEAVQEALDAPCSGFRDDGGDISPGVLDAMPDDAEPGKDAVVLADMRRQFPVDAFTLLKLEVPCSSSSRIARAPSSKCRTSPSSRPSAHDGACRCGAACR